MKILVIDDSVVYRTQIIKHLKEFLPSVEYITARDGKEGWSLYQKEKPDFTLTDLLMPGISGQELLKLIKGIEPKARLIVLSADIQKFTKEEVEKLGVLRFINKPITKEKAAELARIIEED